MSTKTVRRQAMAAITIALIALVMGVNNGYGAAPVNLGTASNYAILAKTGVSTTAGSDVVGNIGISPAAAAAITGFDLIMDASGTFSTSALVTGQIFAADYTEPTPTNLTTAVSDMETAYTNAAGLTPDSTELYAGDLSGQTIYPGTYYWSSAVLINSGVTLAGGADDVWIFQIAQTLTVGNGAIVTLSGGAQAKNIFWQVADQTTLGTTSDFKGIILDKTAIVIQTGAIFSGRTLAQTAVTLDAVNFTSPAAPDTIAPTVISVSPLDSAVDVAVNTNLVATFSEAMNTSATEAACSVNPPVAGVCTWIGNELTYNPDNNLANNTTYTVTIGVGATDISGNPLASQYQWSFTTIADLIPPTVISTNPAADSTGVSIYSKITAVFSEAMDSVTIDTLTFTLTKGLTPVKGVVTYTDSFKMATFAPENNLDTNTVYTATLTTGVKDLAGNALDSAYVWAFTTGKTTNRAPVDLGTAGNFVILAKTGVSTTGTTHVTGNIGLSPAAATYITGFDLIMDASGIFSTSALVTGQIYAADYAPPTPTNMTTAVSDMETAYTDAAGRTLPDFTELHAGDLTGKTLVRGLYKWGTGVLINAPGVTLAGDSNDVWIFQIAGTLTVGNGAIVSLIGGALPKNIFWQVADQTTLGTTVQFKGIILDQTAIVMQTGAALNGRALAQSAVTLDATTVTIPTGIEQPMEGGLTYEKLQLRPCRPNPASGAVNISYVLPRSGQVSLNIYDICGRRVNTLAQGQKQGGTYNITWRGDDSQGRKVSAGVYIYRLNYEGTSLTRRLVLVR
ncbi:MAG: ice-binding family protein [bacterium]|nr:ice-binding family protein [bacterium]